MARICRRPPPPPTARARPAPPAPQAAHHPPPTLGHAPNTTPAAPLHPVFRDFFPDNAVEYFVSYYDYYPPGAYLPRSDTYIEKDSSRNEEID